RWRIVEELRDEFAGLSLDALGRRICIEWSPRHHRAWLRMIVEKLTCEQMLRVVEDKYQLQT
ncbi:MAG: hypothetical protein PHH13_05280, partial [Candidatus Peribacteraceae bacterium]|nr:hypothetical protein [Candidatus Peribacteraceae bacterium]